MAKKRATITAMARLRQTLPSGQRLCTQKVCTCCLWRDAVRSAAVDANEASAAQDADNHTRPARTAGLGNRVGVWRPEALDRGVLPALRTCVSKGEADVGNAQAENSCNVELERRPAVKQREPMLCNPCDGHKCKKEPRQGDDPRVEQGRGRSWVYGLHGSLSLAERPSEAAASIARRLIRPIERVVRLSWGGASLRRIGNVEHR